MQKTGFLFPGQGAQFVGMGKELADSFPAAAKTFREAREILGYDLEKVCFKGPEDELTRTLYAQPAIFVTSIASLRVLQERLPELTPSFTAGLSLGEFTALVAAGSIDFAEALRLVRTRAEAMEEAAAQQKGTMASLMGLDQAACEQIAVEAGCEVANLNAPDQIVLSGTVESVEKSCRLAEEKGAKRAMMLKVGGAFHSSLMLHAKERLEMALKETSIKAPSCVFVPNARAEAVQSPDEIRELLARQLTSSVRWVETMQRTAESGITTWLEVGPGKVLRGLARRCRPDLKVQPCGTPADIEKIEALLAVQES